jgi:MoaA/NifB/PqqE/SkfB family radical SAM enzyme
MSGSYVSRQRIDRAGLWEKDGGVLSHLDIELTERCNNNCLHCCINLPADDLAAKNKELSTAEIRGILKEAACLGYMAVRFTGGEPLLRKDFEELYIFSRRLGLRVLIFTNATLITPRLAGLFSRIPPLEKIEVTVYGMKKKSYESVTRMSGSFAAAQRGISLLLEKKIPFIVKGALLPANSKEREEFEAWAAKIPWMDRSPSYAMFFDLRCRRDNIKNARISKLRLSPEEGLKILTRKKDEYAREMREFCQKFVGPAGSKLFSCAAGTDGGYVDAYGYFQPCAMLRHPGCVYDLKKGSLKDALENYFPKLKGLKSANPGYLRRCARCFLKGLCEQCPAKSWGEHATLDTPVEYLCAIAHSQARYLGLIGKAEMAWEVNNWRERISRLSG